MEWRRKTYYIKIINATFLLGNSSVLNVCIAIIFFFFFLETTDNWLQIYFTTLHYCEKYF